MCVEDYVCENAYLLYEGVANLYVHDLAIRRLTVGDFLDMMCCSAKYVIKFQNDDEILPI